MNPSNIELWISKANVLVKAKNYIKAIECCDVGLKLLWESQGKLSHIMMKDYFIVLTNLKSNSYKAMGTPFSYETSLVYYNDILRIEPTFYPAIIAKSDALYKLNRPQEALDCLNSLKFIEPSASSLRGDILMDQNRFKKAIECFNEVLDYENNFEVRLKKIECLINLEQYDDAYKLINEEMQSTNSDTEKSSLYILLGEILTQSESYEEALNCFLKAKEANPKSLHAWLRLNGVYKELNRRDEARKALNKYFDLYFEMNEVEKKDEVALYNIARMHASEKKVMESIVWFFASLEKKPTEYGYMGLAQALEKLEMFDQALEYINRALRTFPDISLSTKLYYGHLLILKSQFSDAHKYYNSLMEEYPNDVEPIIGFMKTTPKEKLMETVKIANGLPLHLAENPKVLATKALMLYTTGDFKSAVQCYSKAMETFPSDPDIWLSFAFMLWREGYIEQSNKSLLNITGEIWRSPIPWLIRCSLYIKQEKIKDALVALNRAMVTHEAQINVGIQADIKKLRDQIAVLLKNKNHDEEKKNELEAPFLEDSEFVQYWPIS